MVETLSRAGFNVEFRPPGSRLRAEPGRLVVADLVAMDACGAARVLEELAPRAADVVVIAATPGPGGVTGCPSRFRAVIPATAALGSVVTLLWREAGVVDVRVPAPEPGLDRFAGLTHREEKVLAILASGRPANEVAAALSISLPTARAHIQSILRKLQVPTQLAAAALAHEAGWEPGVRAPQGAAATAPTTTPAPA